MLVHFSYVGFFFLRIFNCQFIYVNTLIHLLLVGSFSCLMIKLCENVSPPSPIGSFVRLLNSLSMSRCWFIIHLSSLVLILLSYRTNLVIFHLLDLFTQLSKVKLLEHTSMIWNGPFQFGTNSLATLILTM